MCILELYFKCSIVDYLPWYQFVVYTVHITWRCYNSVHVVMAIFNAFLNLKNITEDTVSLFHFQKELSCNRQAIYLLPAATKLCAKVIFLHLFVILITGGGGGGIPQVTEAHPPRTRHTPPPEADSGIRSTSGRYASYWNAFLLQGKIRKYLSYQCVHFKEIWRNQDWYDISWLWKANSIWYSFIG